MEIGDKVKRIIGGANGLPIGKIGTIKAIDEWGWVLIKGYGTWEHKPETLKLIKDMKKFKVNVTKTTSRILQELAFENGYIWQGGDTDIKIIDQPYLYFEPSKKEIAWGFTGNGSNTQLSLEEVIEQIEREQFQVGDWVCITDSLASSNNETGDVGKITEIDKFKGRIAYRIKVKYKVDHSNWEENIRKATPEEIKKAQNIKFFDWDVERKDQTVKIGCKSFSYDYLENLLNNMKELDNDLKIGEVRDELSRILS